MTVVVFVQFGAVSEFGIIYFETLEIGFGIAALKSRNPLFGALEVGFLDAIRVGDQKPTWFTL